MSCLSFLLHQERAKHLWWKPPCKQFTCFSFAYYPRSTKLDGVHYHFTTKDDFLDQKMDLLNTLKYLVTTMALRRKTTVSSRTWCLAWNWLAEQVRKLFPESKQIFILPNLTCVSVYLIAVQIQLKWSFKLCCWRYAALYELWLLNDDFNKALHELEAVITAWCYLSKQKDTKH